MHARLGCRGNQGISPVSDPNLACTNGATPYGESPEAKRPDTVGPRGHTHEQGTQNPASPTRRQQQDNGNSQLGGRNPSVLPPGIFLDELTGSTLVGRHPARVALGPGRTEEEKTEREDKNIEHTECSIGLSL